MSSYLAEKENLLQIFVSMLYDPACSFKSLQMVV